MKRCVLYVKILHHLNSVMWRITLRSGKGRCYAASVIACFFSPAMALCSVLFVGVVNSQERVPRREELVAAFERITRTVPSPLHLSVEAFISGNQATEEEIRAAWQRNIDHLKSTTGQEISEAEKKELMALFRRSLSEGKHVSYEVWRSRRGKLYRLDEVDLSLDSNASDFTSVNIWDTTFTNVPSFGASRRLGSADIQWDPNARHVELALWDAIGMEVQLAFPLIVALGTTDSDLDSGVELELIRESARIDHGKLENLLSGVEKEWQIVAVDLHDAIPPQVRLSLTGRVVTPENFLGKMPEKLTVTELKIVYQFERDDFQKLRKVELFEEETGMMYSSVRSDYDQQGIPRQWVVRQKPTRGGPEKEYDYRFNLIESFARSEEWEIFAPVFPENYIVGELHGEGRSKIILNPGGGDVLGSPINPIGGFRKFIAKFIVALTFLIPPGYLFRVHKRDREDK